MPLVSVHVPVPALPMEPPLPFSRPANDVESLFPPTVNCLLPRLTLNEVLAPASEPSVVPAPVRLTMLIEPPLAITRAEPPEAVCRKTRPVEPSPESVTVASPSVPPNISMPALLLPVTLITAFSALAVSPSSRSPPFVMLIMALPALAALPSHRLLDEPSRLKVGAFELLLTMPAPWNRRFVPSATLKVYADAPALN